MADPGSQTAADAKMVLIFRILHTIGYAVGSTEATSYIRSTAYFASIYYIIRMYGRCLN